MASEIKSLLKAILTENIDDYSLEGLESPEKGDGYMSDILFITLTPPRSKQSKKYELVWKCGKKSKELRATTPMRQTFITEIFFYDKIIPTFTQFQLEKGIRDPFNSVPECYGTFITEEMEVIVLKNLKRSGYKLWDKKKPLTKKHIELILEEYAKLHSVSVAMSEQYPEKFAELSEGLGETVKEFTKTNDMNALFGTNIIELYDLLKGDLDERTLETWKGLYNETYFIFDGMVDKKEGLKVVLHGDCWCNNFMFKYDGDETSPVVVAIFDWQFSTVSSPILDVSHLIFASISNEDVECINDLLNRYYEQLKFHSSRLGTCLDKLYTKEQFLCEWKKYSKHGILFGCLGHKMCVTEKDEVIDVANAVDGGKDFSNAFCYDVKNKTAFKNRARHVVKYVVENQLV
ncbi:hypothetical protein Zmor_001687 [Zophobas morio]|uniref:CHK kinase-like domain-containing protein n=1 Tax=Zophobas morio TaxID=2755281 RepID=A0AA38MSL6_9CUCU|nr:hypothetical protein Zmor_001687 [Zophobas morio]